MDRIWKYTIVDYKTGCYRWLGGKTSDGYGRLCVDGKGYTITRLVAYFYLGLDLDDRWSTVNHKQFCPNTDCWNIGHIYVGTLKDNMRDVVESGHSKNANKTHCPQGHEYTPENTYVEHDYKGRIGRHCKICMRERYEKWNAERRSRQTQLSPS